MAMKTQPILPSHQEMARVGISIIDAQNVWLRCCACDEAFMPMLDFDGRLPADYWKCPNGCNADTRRSDLH